MKIGYNETLDKSNLETDLKLCGKYGYDSIEIRIEYLQDYLKTHTVEELKAALAENQLQPLALNSVDDINFCTPAQWEKLLERFTFCCEMCRMLGVPYIVVVPTENAEIAQKHPDEIFEDSVRVLRELADIAAPYGAGLAFEPIGNQRWCVRSIRQAADIVNAVDRDAVGLTIDAMNLFCHAGLRDMEDLRQIPAGKVFVYHINDAMDLPIHTLEPEQHRLHPGDGVIPLANFSRILREIGYEGPASLELFNPVFFAQTPEEVMQIGYAKTRVILESMNTVVQSI